MFEWNSSITLFTIYPCLYLDNLTSKVFHSICKSIVNLSYFALSNKYDMTCSCSSSLVNQPISSYPSKKLNWVNSVGVLTIIEASKYFKLSNAFNCNNSWVLNTLQSNLFRVSCSKLVDLSLSTNNSMLKLPKYRDNIFKD